MYTYGYARPVPLAIAVMNSTTMQIDKTMQIVSSLVNPTNCYDSQKSTLNFVQNISWLASCSSSEKK